MTVIFLQDKDCISLYLFCFLKKQNKYKPLFKGDVAAFTATVISVIDNASLHGGGGGGES